ncbi:uncharacterized protein TRUGW13939_07230 [Talaromyces rugulosus]|uniref:Formate dehydrogenase n=1 Tax=Talaromyces rugulosus TaxID=121627 RepID=A0A7H8R255_TALRU|nr:uncharacterized protein TRUGW13939_07230 [Talaromyces rugulosus]QKX60088.1 hypothetical protein TRUGW13939_07230 [Talaromyces rugulosus]
MVLSRSLFRQFQRPAASLFASRPLRAAPAPVFSGIRTLTATAAQQGKVLLVLYDGGEHAKQEPALLGTTENELGIRKWLEDQGHTLVTTSDKEGENSTFDKELVDAEVIITTPFHPGYLTAERLAKAKKLKIAITAGIGSDHVDLNAANKTNGGITVAEVTGSNVVSVAEHVVMTILTLVRNFVPAHDQVRNGDWNVAAVAKNEYDLEGKTVGTVAVGRIGERVLRRLKPFDCKELLYYDYQPLKPEVEKEIGARRVDTLEELVAQCDVVTINCPLHEKTRGLFNKDLIAKMKPGSWLVNTARGAIVVKEDVAEALKSGHLRGYGGDVWFPQPAPKDHPLRYAEHPWGGGNAMVPHMSGTSIDAQVRYAKGTKDILDSYFSGRHDYRPEDLIVYQGDYATKAYGQRKKSRLAPMTGDSRFVFVGDTPFVVQKPLIQATSDLFKDTEVEHLPDEKPNDFNKYLSWAEGKGIPDEEDSNPRWWNSAGNDDDDDDDDDDTWLDLGGLWFFGGRIGARQFQDAVIIKCMEKRRCKTNPLNDLTVDHFFSSLFPEKTPFHTFLVDTCFMTMIDEDEMSEYDNMVFQMACSARQAFLSEVISKMMIEKRKREKRKREGNEDTEESENPAIRMNVLFDYIVSSSPPYDDKKSPAARRADDSSDEDERGSTRMRGSVKLDLIKRVLKNGTVD